MKTIITLLTTTVLAIGATGAISGAFGAEQGSDEAPGYALSWRAAGGLGGVHATTRNDNRDFGAFASAREMRPVRGSTFNAPTGYDFQLDGR